MERTKTWIGAAVGIAAVSAAIWVQNSGGSETTQSFIPNRHVLLNGEAVVSYVTNSDGNNRQPVIVKMDTASGQCWVLQLAVNAPNDPTVQSAVWAPVQLNAAFQPRGGNNSD